MWPYRSGQGAKSRTDTRDDANAAKANKSDVYRLTDCEYVETFHPALERRSNDCITETTKATISQGHAIQIQAVSD